VTSAADPTIADRAKAFARRFAPSHPSITDGYVAHPAANDPTSLANMPIDLNPDVYAAAAGMSEARGQLEAARTQYSQALKRDVTHRPSLLGLARLQQQAGDTEAAIATYRRAAEAYPHDAAIWNDLGLCYARRGESDLAVQALGSAVRIEPAHKIYRGNLAAALVEAGRTDEAVRCFSDNLGPAMASYNVGYLLHKNGKNAEAADYLQHALSLDPSLHQARSVLDQVAPHVGSRPRGAPARPATDSAILRN
jgi:Flp pilus assembly protein TadD